MRRLLNVRPRGGVLVLLGLAPIVVLLLIYLLTSEARHALNPNDKILPTFAAIARAIDIMAFQVDPQRGEIPLWMDTRASLSRLGIALGISTMVTLALGLLLGLLPVFRALTGPIITAIAMAPPIALLPILFIVLGLGEASKIGLIMIGVIPAMVRDLGAHVRAIPEEQLIKAQTLGASTWQIMLRVALPQALPRLIEIVRLQLGAAWVFLISAEAIAADVGLGYRIFLVRRYLSMDIILPYVVWIALLAVTLDFLLAAFNRTAFSWAHPKGAR
ncbi:MAG: ABC transporter permease subunit [Hyphomonadaceae bacterium]|nr:ABC transporter permease subunit [Hyphomonadaceae bacterium]